MTSVCKIKYTVTKENVITLINKNKNCSSNIIQLGVIIMAVAVEKNIPSVEKTIISISPTRQITIPQKFFTMLNFGDEAECIIHGDELIIRPTKFATNDNFAEQILSDLISQGLSGEKLLSEFKKMQSKIRPAIENILSEAKQVPENKDNYATYDDIFNSGE